MDVATVALATAGNAHPRQHRAHGGYHELHVPPLTAATSPRHKRRSSSAPCSRPGWTPRCTGCRPSCTPSPRTPTSGRGCAPSRAWRGLPSTRRCAGSPRCRRSSAPPRPTFRSATSSCRTAARSSCSSLQLTATPAAGATRTASTCPATRRATSASPSACTSASASTSPDSRPRRCSPRWPPGSRGWSSPARPCGTTTTRCVNRPGESGNSSP